MRCVFSAILELSSSVWHTECSSSGIKRMRNLGCVHHPNAEVLIRCAALALGVCEALQQSPRITVTDRRVVAWCPTCADPCAPGQRCGGAGLMFVRPHPAGTADLVNIAVVLGFDAAVLYLCGFKALMYLALGTVMGGGMHPMAGHLISEHYMFIKARER